MNTLQEIDTKARLFADARTALAEEVGELTAKIEALQRQHLARIRLLVGRTKEHHAALVAMIEDSRDLFTKPKSVVFHGIKLGLAKGRGGLVIEDDEETLRLIHKHYPDDEAAAALIVVTEKPDKNALKELPAKELAKLGCEIEGVGEVAFAKPTDGAVDKVVKALLKESPAEAEAKEAA